MNKILVIGYGSIGKRHVENLKTLMPRRDILVYRPKNKQNVPGIQTFTNLGRALAEKPKAAIIASPASFHIRQALQCAKRDVHILIEKPVSHNRKGVQALQKIVKQRNLTTMIGCNLRFHPGLKFVHTCIKHRLVGNLSSIIINTGQYLPDWRQNTPCQKTTSAQKSLGGGVILDLIHELDYTYWFFGSPEFITCATGSAGILNIDTEEYADMLLHYKTGMNAHIHLDYLQRVPMRTCTIIGGAGTIVWDYFNGEVVVTVGNKTKRHSYKNFNINQTYLDELKHFLTCARQRKQTIIPLHEGERVLALALAAKHSARRQKPYAIT